MHQQFNHGIRWTGYDTSAPSNWNGYHWKGVAKIDIGNNRNTVELLFCLDNFRKNLFGHHRVLFKPTNSERFYPTKARLIEKRLQLVLNIFIIFRTVVFQKKDTVTCIRQILAAL